MSWWMLAISSSNHRQRSGGNLADGNAIPGSGLLLTTWQTPTLGFRKQERQLRTGSTAGCLRSIALVAVHAHIGLDVIMHFTHCCVSIITLCQFNGYWLRLNKYLNQDLDSSFKCHKNIQCQFYDQLIVKSKNVTEWNNLLFLWFCFLCFFKCITW